MIWAIRAADSDTIVYMLVGVELPCSVDRSCPPALGTPDVRAVVEQLGACALLFNNDIAHIKFGAVQ